MVPGWILYFFKTQKPPHAMPFMLFCRNLYLFVIVYPVKPIIFCFTETLAPFFWHHACPVYVAMTLIKSYQIIKFAYAIVFLWNSLVWSKRYGKANRRVAKTIRIWHGHCVIYVWRRPLYLCRFYVPSRSRENTKRALLWKAARNTTQIS